MGRKEISAEWGFVEPTLGKLTSNSKASVRASEPPTTTKIKHINIYNNFNKGLSTIYHWGLKHP